MTTEPRSAHDWVQHEIALQTSPVPVDDEREDTFMSTRYRVEPVPPATNAVALRQWRVVDGHCRDKIIYPGADLGTAHRMADQLNAEHNTPEVRRGHGPYQRKFRGRSA